MKKLGCELVHLSAGIQGAEIISTSWYDKSMRPETGSASSTSRKYYKSDSHERVDELFSRIGTGASALSVFGQAWARSEQPHWANRWQVYLGGDASKLFYHLHNAVSWSIQFDYCVRRSMTEWRTIAKQVVDCIGNRGVHGCGVVEISRASDRVYGMSFGGLVPADGFDRQSLWNRWCLLLQQNIDRVPWPSQGVIISPSVIARVGGLARIKHEVVSSLRVPPSDGDSLMLEATACGGALLWLSPDYHHYLPERGESRFDHCFEADRAARMYLKLQDLGIAC
ncbi:MAG: hypothetical protein IBJ18_09895 [Phycisphaerales bacterium]|nr:hypothetical protein [Phycisphaerales bacterium]